MQHYPVPSRRFGDAMLSRVPVAASDPANWPNPNVPQVPASVSVDGRLGPGSGEASDSQPHLRLGSSIRAWATLPHTKEARAPIMPVSDMRAVFCWVCSSAARRVLAPNLNMAPCGFKLAGAVRADLRDPGHSVGMVAPRQPGLAGQPALRPLPLASPSGCS